MANIGHFDNKVLKAIFMMPLFYISCCSYLKYFCGIFIYSYQICLSKILLNAQIVKYISKNINLRRGQRGYKIIYRI